MLTLCYIPLRNICFLAFFFVAWPTTTHASPLPPFRILGAVAAPPWSVGRSFFLLPRNCEKKEKHSACTDYCCKSLLSCTVVLYTTAAARSTCSSSVIVFFCLAKRDTRCGWEYCFVCRHLTTAVVYRKRKTPNLERKFAVTDMYPQLLCL